MNSPQIFKEIREKAKLDKKVWADREVEETTYTTWYVEGVVRCGPEPTEQNVKSQEYAEKNILG